MIIFVIKSGMISQEIIADIIDNQNTVWIERDQGVLRNKLEEIKLHQGFATIITGVRRCGKSTLLRQLLPTVVGKSIFLNFEDPRLTGFEIDDFRRLDKELEKRAIKNLFLDEVQMLNKWEVYVRQKLDEGYNIVVTGSNASLLSKELGTKLTGRHLSYELFPFLYSEYLQLREVEESLEKLSEYLKDGGFPDYIKTKIPLVLQQLLDDILLRDIAVRYGVRDAQSLRRLAVYLLSNIGKPISASKLSKNLEIKATSTILEYFAYMEDAYLVQFIPKFSYSLKTQIRNPKKVYAIDLGVFTHNSVVFTDDWGRRLENLVFLHYRRKGRQLYYFNEKKECDFVVFNKDKLDELVQVCYHINEDNLKREIEGLEEAMNFFDVQEGKIITFNQTDEYNIKGKKIKLIPYRELGEV
ncbi:MAG: ATP-binding protein [Chitinophagales bacterium]|nr:ATP-binding protein [Chitinophagales bacterium]